MSFLRSMRITNPSSSKRPMPASRIYRRPFCVAPSRFRRPVRPTMLYQPRGANSLHFAVWETVLKRRLSLIPFQKYNGK
jgi:hypothetical protein